MQVCKYKSCWTWGVVFLAVAFAMVVRLRLLEVPLSRDEGEYAYTARLMLEGIPPYKGVYNEIMPGVFGAYALAMTIFGQTVAGIRLGLLAVNILSIILIFLIGRKIFGSSTGVVAGAVFSVLSLCPVAHGFIANPEHFLILFVLAGFFLLLKALESDRPGYFLSSGFFLGISVVMKQNGVFYVMFALGYLLYEMWRKRLFPRSRKILISSIFLVGSGLPAVLTVLWLLSVGAFEQFWLWTVTYAWEYVSAFSLNLDVLRGVIKERLFPIMHFSSFIWAFAGIGMVGLFADKEKKPHAFFVLMFLIFSIVSICPGFYFRWKYFVLLFPAISLLAGLGIDSATKIFFKEEHFVIRKGLLVLLTTCVLAFSVYQQRVFFFYLTPWEISRGLFGKNPFRQSLKIAEYITERTTRQDTIAILGSEPQILFYANRRSPTGFIYVYPLVRTHPFALEMQKDMSREIEAGHPKFLIFVGVRESWIPENGYERLIFQWFRQYHTMFYKCVGVVDILSPESTRYVWGEEAAKYQPRSKNWLSIFERKEGT